ncbi:MAG: hypothetical protein DI536_25885 [Archangium gephyra]|uniref:Uncharacterized protein n=1 Tax=Archangium gephyra TaxID=48 RepID=A0A2W5UGF4_9BACT|nr:MAG: hypothetical protein DI536_25885 [Archangium gephyra]
MSDAKTELQTLKTEILAFKDNVKLKAALAKMDLKAQWDELEPQLERAASSASIVSQEVVGDLKRRFEEFKARIAAS